MDVQIPEEDLPAVSGGSGVGRQGLAGPCLPRVAGGDLLAPARAARDLPVGSVPAAGGDAREEDEQRSEPARQVAQRISSPPFTISDWPVTLRARSDRKKATT